MSLKSLHFEWRGQPPLLLAVAALWMVGAGWAMAAMAILIYEGQSAWHLGILNLFFAWGFLLHDRGIRNVALAGLWLAVIWLIGTVYWLLATMSPGGEWVWRILPGLESPIPGWLAIGVYVVWVLLNLWQIHVLCRPEIARLFAKVPHEAIHLRKKAARLEAGDPEPGWWVKYY